MTKPNKEIEMTMEQAREIAECAEIDGAQPCDTCPRNGLKCNEPYDCVKIMVDAARMMYGSVDAKQKQF